MPGSVESAQPQDRGLLHVRQPFLINYVHDYNFVFFYVYFPPRGSIGQEAQCDLYLSPFLSREEIPGENPGEKLSLRKQLMVFEPVASHSTVKCLTQRRSDERAPLELIAYLSCDFTIKGRSQKRRAFPKAHTCGL